MDVNKTISETVETLTSLNECDRSMAFMVLALPNTPFEGFVSLVTI